MTQVCEYFGVGLETGLTSQQVVNAQQMYGRNELAPDEGKPLWRLILKQFDDLLVKILIVAALVDFFIAFAGGEGLGAFVEPAVIVLILIANATVGVLTETNADKAIHELKAYEADSATLLRDGRWTVTPAVEIVPGDVVEVAVGGKVPADLRVVAILSSTLRVDQSILTGESGSVAKEVAAVTAPRAVYQDKTNTLFSGTVVTAGRCRGVATGTGPSTAIGKIRDAMTGLEDNDTPLRKKLDELGALLSKARRRALYYFKIAVALAVAAIPEGLPAVVTTCLALGTRQMARQNAIVRKLPSVETLGCTTVICSDKTGTLTTNQMTVVRAATVEGEGKLAQYEITGTSYAPQGEVLEHDSVLACPADKPALGRLAICAALCNDSHLTYSVERGTYQRIGEATEVALRVLAEKVGLPGYAAMPQALAQLSRQERATYCNDHWASVYHKTFTLDFSRDRRMMSTLCAGPEGDVLFVKGAPESVLQRCTSVMTEGPGSGASVPLTPELRTRLLQQVTEYGMSGALRTLGLACRPWLEARGAVLPADEAGLTFLGLVGLQDPPRPAVAAAVAACRAAGIRVVMVTGDNKSTACSVARQVGLLGPGDAPDAPGSNASLAGLEFDELDEGGRAAAAGALVVFARVEPNHKTALVDLLRGQGHVVAMTGDGVNDAPALRRADIGVAMGSGTAVAKHAADMVLADDNFATIVSAVAAGRAIFANTKQFIRYMISSNIGEVVAIFSAALVGIPECLNPVQLLWVNLVTDGLPATAIGFNKPDPYIMQQKPRRANEGVVDSWLFTRYMVVGAYVGIATVSGFIWWFMSFEGGPQLAWSELRNFQHCEGSACDVFRSRNPSTVSMSVLVVVEMFNALNALSENGSLLTTPPWSNPWLVAAISVSMLLHLIILYVPALALLFSVVPLSWTEWKVVLLLSAPILLVDEVLKLISRTFFSDAPVTSGSGGSTTGAGRPRWQLSLPWFRRGADGGVKYAPILAGSHGVDLTRKKSDEFGRVQLSNMA